MGNIASNNFMYLVREVVKILISKHGSHDSDEKCEKGLQFPQSVLVKE